MLRSPLISAWFYFAVSACASAQPGGLSEVFSSGGEGDLRSRIRASRTAASQEPLVTDRPDFTEASSVVGLGIVQLESGYTFFHRDDDFDGSINRLHSFPEALWRIGLHEGVELRIISSYLWEDAVDAGARSTPEGGTDLGLGFKFQLLRNKSWIPETALISSVVLQTGARAFRTEDVDTVLVLLYSWELPRGWSLGANTGLATGTQDVPILQALTDRDGHTTLFQSVALGRSLTDSIGMYVEYFGLYSVGRHENFPANYVDGGFTYLLNNDVQFDVRAGAGLNDHADDLFTGAGLSLRF